MVKIKEINLHFVENQFAKEVAIPPLNTYLINEDIHLK